MQLIEIVTEAIIGDLLGVNILFYCQLNFTQECVHEQNIDEDIPCTQIESVFDPNDLERFTFLTDLLYFFENSDDFGLSWLDFAPEKIWYFESDQIDVHIFKILLIMFMSFF